MTETQGLLLALLWGILFNWLIVRLARAGWGDGFTAAWVVIGVFVTLIISSLVHVSLPRLGLFWQGERLILTNQQHAAVYELKFFIAAGIPMVIGSLRRYLRGLDASIDGTDNL